MDDTVKQKSFSFAIRIVKLTKYLRENKKEAIMSNQQFSSIISDCREVEKMLVSIVKTAKNNV